MPRRVILAPSNLRKHSAATKKQADNPQEYSMENKKLGGNIDSWCGKCKLVLAHTIEAMVGDKPARVHCNTCGSQHSYKPNPPGTATRKSAPRDPAAGPPVRVSKGRTSRYQSLLNAKGAAN